MELSSSDKERIQHQYDALAKKTLVGEAKSHRRTLAKRAAREVTFSDLSESELAQLFTTDEYESDYFRFQVSGFDVLVKNELLAEALNALPERKRDIVLLSYFLDMSDAEIGELLSVVRTTVFLAQFEAIKKLAAEGPCVMVGRCADYALADNKDCFSVFIHADLDWRIKRIAGKYNKTPKEAKDMISKTDKSRASRSSYSLCIIVSSFVNIVSLVAIAAAFTGINCITHFCASGWNYGFLVGVLFTVG